MINILLCVVFSVSVSILLKLAAIYKINVAVAVAMNYLIAIACVFILLKPEYQVWQWNADMLSVLLALGILLPSIFLILGKAVSTAGIVRSDAAQRLSLFIPIVASFTYFGEHLSVTRFFGLLLAFAALFCLLDKKQDTEQKSSFGWLYLLLVWLGFGLIDIGFKSLAKTGQSSSMNLLMVFALAGTLMWLYVLLKRYAFDSKSLLAGVVLGCLNFGNIWFYIRAHQEFSYSPTLVFTGVNIGVIIGGLFVGVMLFKEKLSKWNYLGVGLASLAIAVLFYLEKWLRYVGIYLEI